MEKRGKWNIAKLWKDRHLPKSMKKKISRTKKRLYREGKIKPYFKGKHFTEQHRKNLSFFRIEYFKKHPEARIQQGIRQRRLMSNPDIKAKMIRSQKALWTKERRNEWSEKTKQLYEERPEVLRKIRKKAIQFSNAHSNQNRLWALKTYFHLLVDEEARKKIERNWKNPHNRVIPSSLGKVRSKYEKKVADFLAKLKDYKTEYETKRLYFEGYESNPDFFVTSRKDKDFMCIVEVYGLHYMAERKKREKQHYYKEYHLPVIGITPAETYNLDYALAREIEKLKKSKYAKISYIKRFENPLYTIKQSKNYGKLKKMLKENPELRKEVRKILGMIREIKIKGKSRGKSKIAGKNKEEKWKKKDCL